MKISDCFSHVGTLVINTQRLLLRPFKKTDAQAMFNNWASDENVSKYLTWPTHSSVEVTQMVIDGWVNSYQNLDTYLWGIELLSNRQLIGSISVVGLNEKTLTMSLGYCIGTAYWNQGITSEALKGVIDYLFTNTGVNRIAAAHDVHNPASGKVMGHAHMTFEGVLRQASRNNQGVCDLAVYSILRNEWRKDI